jgi:hypothetical protein
MSLNIEIGNGAIARGFCCVAIGDGTEARGMFQVSENRDTITVPKMISAEARDQTIAGLQDMKLTYQSIVKQGQAPEDFGNKACDLIDFIVAQFQQCWKDAPSEKAEPQKENVLVTPSVEEIDETPAPAPRAAEAATPAEVKKEKKAKRHSSKKNVRKE